MISRGKPEPVFSGFISGCEVHVPLGSACEFFVQARNDAGHSEPSARASIQVPSEPKRLPVSRGGKPGGGAQLKGSTKKAVGAGTALDERRRAEAKSRLNLAEQAASEHPTDANLDALRQAIRAAVVVGINVRLLDRARQTLQKAHNAKEKRGAMEARLRSSLATRDPQILKMAIKLAEGAGVANTHDGCLLATAKGRLAQLTALADLASQNARATAEREEEVPAMIEPDTHRMLAAHTLHGMLRTCIAAYFTHMTRTGASPACQGGGAPHGDARGGAAADGNRRIAVDGADRE